MAAQGTPPPGGMTFSGAASTPPRGAPSQKPSRTPRRGTGRKKPSRGAVGRWVGTGALALAALVAMGVSTTIAAETDEAVAPGIKRVLALDARTQEAQDAIAALPDETSAKRGFEAAARDAMAVADLQNALNRPGDPVVLDSFGDPLPEEERETQEAADARAWDEASRALAAFFTAQSAEPEVPEEPSGGATPVDPTSSWFVQRGLMGDWAWSASAATSYSDDGLVPTVWSARAGDGTLLAWTEAEYDPIQNRFGAPLVSITEAGWAFHDQLKGA